MAGVDMVCAEFTYPASTGTGEAMLYLGGYTDFHRGDLTPCYMTRTGSTFVTRVLLPADAVLTYFFVTGPQLNPTIGHTRAGWLDFVGQAEPAGPGEKVWMVGGQRPERVWRGPNAIPALDYPEPFSASPDGIHDRRAWRLDGWREYDRASAFGPRRMWVHHTGSARSWLIVHDGQVWWRNRLGWALNTLKREDVGVLLIDSQDFDRRERDLAHADRATEVTNLAVRLIEELAGDRPAPENVITCGQSFGGLASVYPLLADNPAATRALCQSGSFWYQPKEGLSATEKASRQAHEGIDISLRVGTDEPRMKEPTVTFARTVAETGAEVDCQMVRGGHSWARWRDDLISYIAT